jgi:hypothetical protein
MYGRNGDLVAKKAVDNQTTYSEIIETWKVTLTNQAAAGSASYEVTIKQKFGPADDGDEVASISVRSMGSN